MCNLISTTDLDFCHVQHRKVVIRHMRYGRFDIGGYWVLDCFLRHFRDMDGSQSNSPETVFLDPNSATYTRVAADGCGK